jgi:hypothetical protein
MEYTMWKLLWKLLLSYYLSIKGLSISSLDLVLIQLQDIAASLTKKRGIKKYGKVMERLGHLPGLGA